MIQVAAIKKLKKAQELATASMPYPPGTVLLVYLNIVDFSVHEQAIEAIFDTAV